MKAPFNLTPRKLLILARIMIAGLLLLTLAVAIYYLIENAVGRRIWREVEQEATSRGEALTLAKTLPAPVPPEENFAASPVFAASFERRAPSLADVLNGRQSLAERWRMSTPKIAQNGMSEFTRAGFGLWWQGEAVPLDEWREFLDTPDLLGFLDAYTADMTAIAEAAQRPHARFDVDYEHSVFAGMPYLPATHSLARLFALRAAAQIEQNHGTAALPDVITVFRLVRTLRDEPFILTHLAANACATIGLQVLRSGLAHDAWTNEELATLAAELAQLDLLGDAMRGLRAELAFSAELMARLDRDPEKTLDSMSNGNGYDARFVNYVPSGWVHRNMALTARIFLDDVFPSYDARARRINLDQLHGVDQKVRSLQPNPYSILARMFMPAFYRAITNSAATQTQIELAQIACALEIHRRAHKQYPASLDALADVPGIRAIHDLVTGEPPRYRQLGGGQAFALYTTGANNIDDGGHIALTKEGALDPYKGDWVWPTPLSEEASKRLSTRRREEDRINRELAKLQAQSK